MTNKMLTAHYKGIKFFFFCFTTDLLSYDINPFAEKNGFVCKEPERNIGTGSISTEG